jgi:hypothetical protein
MDTKIHAQDITLNKRDICRKAMDHLMVNGATERKRIAAIPLKCRTGLIFTGSPLCSTIKLESCDTWLHFFRELMEDLRNNATGLPHPLNLLRRLDNNH